MPRTATPSLLALPLVAALALTACSGDGGTAAAARPSAAELTAVFAEGSDLLGDDALPAEEAQCWGDTLYSSDVSDATLRALVDNDEDYVPADEEAESEALMNAMLAAFEDCGLGE